MNLINHTQKLVKHGEGWIDKNSHNEKLSKDKDNDEEESHISPSSSQDDLL